MRTVELTLQAAADLAWWAEREPKVVSRIVRLMREAQETPFIGAGKPEPLKYGLRGCWSRRITQTDRLVYEVHDDRIRVLACRYHY